MQVPPNALTMWVVYEKPSDYPHVFVARPHYVVAGKVVVDMDTCIIGPTLGAVRSQLPPGLARLNRDPNDEPHIVEIWL